MAAGTIVQASAGGAGPIEISGGLFTWTGGDINPAQTEFPNVAGFTIDAQAGARFANTTAPGQFGDALNVFGLLELANTQTITLVNQPLITNSGIVMVTVDNTAGLWADAPVTIQNYNLFEKGGTTGTYQITDPISNVGANAVLQVDQGILEFVAGDVFSGYSVNQTSGDATAAIRVAFGATLQADADVGMSSGLMTGTSISSDGWVKGNVNMTGGTLDAGTGGFRIQGNFQFSSGTVQITYDTNAGTGGFLQVIGNVAVTNATTTVGVSFIGAGNLPGFIDVISTLAGTIDNVTGTNPNGYTPSLEVNNHRLRLTKNS